MFTSLKKNICFQSASAPLVDATATPAAARVGIDRGWAAPYQTRRDLPAQTRVDWAWRGACLISPSTSSTPTAGVSAATSRGHPPMVATSGRILVSLGLHPIAEVSYFQGSLSYGVSQGSYLGEFGSPPYSGGQLLPGVALLWWQPAILSQWVWVSNPLYSGDQCHYFQGSPSYGGTQRLYLGEFGSLSYSGGQDHYFQGSPFYGGSQRLYLGGFGSPSYSGDQRCYFQRFPSYGGDQRSYLGESGSPF